MQFHKVVYCRTICSCHFIVTSSIEMAENNRHGAHCSKVKMNGKKLSKFQFHFPGLLGTSPMLKQEKNFFYIIGIWILSHLFVLGSRWTGPRFFFEMSKVTS
jgi:hypothetical protein